MLNKLYSHSLKLVFASGLVFCLVLVRYYENVLFYDPFLDYFKGDYNQLDLPSFEVSRLILSLFFRYSLNMLFSLGLIYVLFKDFTMIKFSFFLYLIALVLLLLLFFLVIHFYGSQNKFLLFYIRRFLTQPIFIMLFIPAFYFQKQHS